MDDGCTGAMVSLCKTCSPRSFDKSTTRRRSNSSSIERCSLFVRSLVSGLLGNKRFLAYTVFCFSLRLASVCVIRLHLIGMRNWQAKYSGIQLQPLHLAPFQEEVASSRCFSQSILT